MSDIRYRIAGVVGGTYRSRIGTKDRIAARRAEIKQRIKRRIPSAVRPDIVENSVIINSVTASNRHFALASRIPGKSDTWCIVMILRVPHTRDGPYPGGRDTGAVQNVAASQVRKLRQNAMDFARRAVTVPAYPEVQGELGSDLPVVLNEPAVVVIVVVAISVGFRSRRRVN